MTPAEFIKKWGDSTLRERQGAQEHFTDLCRLIGEPTPAEDDPFGERYCFERGAEKTGGGAGWADVWRKNCFGWEYKGKHKDLGAALRQLQAYALDLQNPPYLVVSDMARIVVHTNWTNTVSRRLEFTLDDLREPGRLDQLRDVFRGSERLRPGLSPQQLTHDVAERFGTLGRRLQERGHAPRAVAHFLNRVVFCLFAEHAGLLPPKLFTRMIKGMMVRPRLAKKQFEELFATMGQGGFFGADIVLWFNGGLFDDTGALPLDYEDFKLISDSAAEHDWAEIDPAIFGTLFEEALKAERKRAALGAHYTDRDKILKIVEPVITRPLMAEWAGIADAIRGAADEARTAAAERAAVMERVAASLDAAGAEAVLAGERRAAASSGDNLELFDDAGASRLSGAAGRAIKKAQPELTALVRRRAEAFQRARALRDGFLDRLAAFRVLDPACGSGNFLYVALHALRDIELRALMDAERLGVPQVPPRVTLKGLFGIEIEPYAAELARVTLWIGDLQWKRRNGYTAYVEPVLEALDGIENRDALLNQDGTEAAWPETDVIVGNPPFLGGKKLKPTLGEAYVASLRAVFAGRVPDGADYVCHWFQKANEYLKYNRVHRVGLVATSSISGGSNMFVLGNIVSENKIFDAWDDEPWTLAGAAIRVALISFSRGVLIDEIRLNGKTVVTVFSDLTSTDGVSGVDISAAKSIPDNKDVAFQGIVPRSEINRAEKAHLGLADASFLVSREEALRLLRMPLNVNGRRNNEVVRPYIVGEEIVKRIEGRFIIDFDGLSLEEASLYEGPFEHIRSVKSHRAAMNQPEALLFWWRHWNTRPKMKKALHNLRRYIVTPRVAKHRVFAWMQRGVLPDCQVVAIAREDDESFGILTSRFHQLWTLRMCTFLGVGNDPRYTPRTTFETYPFPKPSAALKLVAAAAAELEEKRQAWLNPPDIAICSSDWPGLFDPVDNFVASQLRERTLTKLYNRPPTWLTSLHKQLDAAVAASYGWNPNITDDEALKALYNLNQLYGA